MSHHLFIPAPGAPWYGHFGHLTLRNGYLAAELRWAFDFTFPYVSRDGEHLWVHDFPLWEECTSEGTGSQESLTIPHGPGWSWGVCPVLVDIPEVGPALYLRAIAESDDIDPASAECLTESRRSFALSLAHKLMIPVLVSDDVDHIDKACLHAGFEEGSTYPVADMVAPRKAGTVFALAVGACNPHLTTEEAQEYALKVAVLLAQGVDMSDIPKPPLAP